MTSVSAQKAASFVGIARIDLDKLSFQAALKNEHRAKSDRSVARLLNVFELEGCRRLEEENFIEALISHECLASALEEAGITEASLSSQSLTAPRDLDAIYILEPHQAIQCLNGVHRIHAAKKFLDNNDRWWVVKLYREESFVRSLKRHVYESFNHEQSYTDGTIFRNIRLYANACDEVEENKWWARLTETKKKDLRQLLNGHKYGSGVKRKTLVNAFDELLPFSGLWPPIQLGFLHRLHGLRCHKELTNYLIHVKNVWTSIVPMHHWMHVDESTVSKLELLAPAVSNHDRRRIEKMMRDKDIFPLVTSEPTRTEILQNILSQKLLIPSLRTFFENQKYLEPCSKVLRSLLDDSEKRPLWRAFKANYWPPPSAQMQYSESFKSMRDLQLSAPIPLKSKAKFAYLQLWLFCMRHFPEMSNIKPKIESRRKTVQRDYNFALLQQLGGLAVRLGFRTTKALDLAVQDADEKQAERFLRSVRPKWPGNISDQITKVRSILSQMEEPLAGLPTEVAFSGIDCCPRDRRCGLPHDDDHDRDKSALFATIFYHPVHRGDQATSLFVKRSILEGFFGPFILSVEQQVMSTYEAMLSQQSDSLVHNLQQNVQLLRESETEKLTTELATSRQQIAEAQAIAVEQFGTFQDSLREKSARIRELETQLNTRSQGSQHQDQLATRELEVRVNKGDEHILRLEGERQQLRMTIEMQAERITRLRLENERVIREVETSRSQVNKTFDTDNRSESGVSDVIGTHHENGALGGMTGIDEDVLQQYRAEINQLNLALDAAKQEAEFQAQQSASSNTNNEDALHQHRAEIDRLNLALVAAKQEAEFQAQQSASSIADNENALKQYRADIDRLSLALDTAKDEAESLLQKSVSFDQKRHHRCNYVVDPASDLELSFRMESEYWWHRDIRSIYEISAFSRPAGSIHLHILKEGHGLRSLLVTLPNDPDVVTSFLSAAWPLYGMFTTRLYAVQHGAEQRDNGTFVETLPVLRLLTFARDDANSFIQTCQQKDVIVFLAKKEIFPLFFKEYVNCWEFKRRKAVGDKRKRLGEQDPDGSSYNQRLRVNDIRSGANKLALFAPIPYVATLSKGVSNDEYL